MCWVMPPASPAATSVSRIASSSEVLPWSTWPMIVTTGGRSTRSSSASSNSGSSGSSSAARTISILRSYSSAIARIDSSVSVWVSVAISPIIISFLITSAGARPIASPSSRTVAPELTLVASGSTGVCGPIGGSSRSGPTATATAAARRTLRRRAAHLVAAGGLRIDHDAAFFARGAAAATGGGPPAGRTGLFDGRFFGGGFRLIGLPGEPVPERVCRLPGLRGRRRFAAAGAGAALAALRRRRSFGRSLSRFGRRLAFGGAVAATAVRRAERAQRVGLLDAGGGHFGFDPCCVQRFQHLFRADALRFRDLVNPLFCH